MANLPQDIILYLCIFKRCLDAIIEGFVGPSIPGVPLVAYNSGITALIKIYIFTLIRILIFTNRLEIFTFTSSRSTALAK